MEFTEVIKNRYSVRAYKSVPIEDEKLNEVLEAARLAPTACNLQPFQFIVIHTKGKEEDLKHICRVPWFSQAPIIICACAIESEGWVRKDGTNYSFIDLAIAVDHLILAATNLGLGTCWVGAFDVKAAREVLKIPAGVEPLIFIPLGYSNDQAGAKYRKPIEELVRYEQY
ncbi:MAG: nitroreductase family protein [Dehalococcoidales bacterium]|nr:nitroreductase family protein [Dehalococcoidales bacterium]